MADESESLRCRQTAGAWEVQAPKPILELLVPYLYPSSGLNIKLMVIRANKIIIITLAMIV